MAGMAASKTRAEVVAAMKKLDMSTSSNKKDRYSGGNPVGKTSTANKPLKHSGGSC